MRAILENDSTASVARAESSQELVHRSGDVHLSEVRAIAHGPQESRSQRRCRCCRRGFGNHDDDDDDDEEEEEAKVVRWIRRAFSSDSSFDVLNKKSLNQSPSEKVLMLSRCAPNANEDFSLSYLFCFFFAFEFSLSLFFLTSRELNLASAI